MSHVRHYELSVQSDLANLERVAAFITRVAAETGLDEKQTYEVQMAVDEAVTNVMEHAYHGRKDGLVSVLARLVRRDFVVEIRDRGKPFDVRKVRTPRTRGPLSRRAVGGLGIFFMKKLMDEVEFSVDPAGGNLVRMVKHLK